MQIYEGTENYIFISYAHKDSDTVLPMMQYMQDKGFRIWYDSGVEAGTEWPEYIAEHLENAAVVLVLMSNAATASRNCRDEINFALDMGKDMLVVHLEEAKLTAGMRLRLSAIQAMFRYRSKDDASFLAELCKAKLLQSCKIQKTVSSAAVEVEAEVSAAAAAVAEVPPKVEETPEALCARADLLYQEGNFDEAAACYRKAAGLGHPDSLAGLARCYFNGHGVAQDYDEAFDLFAEAAEKGSARGMCGLGNAYYEGHGAKKNYDRAFDYYRVAAEHGDFTAMNNLAICFEQGHGTKENQEEAIRLFRKAAEAGYPDAMFNLGKQLLNGTGIPKNQDQGIDWLTKAAVAGHEGAAKLLNSLEFLPAAAAEGSEAAVVAPVGDAESLFEQGRRHYRNKEYDQAAECYRRSMEQGSQNGTAGYGLCLYYGYGVQQDLDQALDLFLSSAQSGSAMGQTCLGFCYIEGKIVKKSSARAATWFRRAADQGHPQAVYNLGLLYYKGDGVPQDYSIAFDHFRRAADQGYEGAMYQLGICYEEGHGAAKNKNEAIIWFQKAADKGYEKAKVKLGLGSAPAAPTGSAEDAEKLCKQAKELYDQKKYPEAFRLYKQAADMGSADAKAGLGRCYLNGNGTSKDPSTAFRLFSEAASLGSNLGETGVGDCYYDGAGVTRDYQKAAEHYRKATKMGNSVAMVNLGYCYSKGHGVPENATEAFDLYRMAAKKGNAQGMFNLALCFQNGRGTVKSEEQAEHWFKSAADAGHEKAKAKVIELEEAKKKKAAASIPSDFVILDNSGNSIDIMEYMEKLSLEAKKRRYVCPKCKTGFYTADTQNSEPCPNCGATVNK